MAATLPQPRTRISPSAIRARERMELPIAQVVEHYLTSKKLRGLSPKTLRGLRSNLGLFLRFLEKDLQHSMKLGDLDIEHARAFIASMQGPVTMRANHPFNQPVHNAYYSPETIYSRVRDLRSLSNWMYQEGYTKRPIFERLELPKLPQKKIDVLSPEEIKQILDSINPNTLNGARMMAMILVMLDTGIRAGELVGMKMADMDWERGVFKVFGKGAKERFVPIGTTAKQALLRYVQTFRPEPARPDIDNILLSVDGYPLSVNAIVHMMYRLRKASGVQRLHAYLLLHTCGVQYLVAGGDTKSLQMFLGHSTPAMTHHYEQFKDEHVLAQHRKFSPVDSLGLTYRRFGRKKNNENGNGGDKKSK